MINMPKSVAARVVAAARNIKKLHHDKRNDYQSYNYTSVDNFYEAVGPIIAEAGLFIVVDEVAATVDKGMLTSNYEIYLVSEEGDSYGPIRRQATVKAAGPQSYASAQSFAEKYFLRQIFKIPTGEADADSELKTTLPDIKPLDVKPQVEKLSERESLALKDDAIALLNKVETEEDLAGWKAAQGTELKRKLHEEHTKEVTKRFREIEAKLKEQNNGEV
jgi:hypothetical protein